MSTSPRKVRRAGNKAARRPASGKTRESTTRAKGKGERPSAPGGEVDPDVLEFIEALDRFKRRHDKPFPTWSEVLSVVRSLGYRKG